MNQALGAVWRRVRLLPGVAQIGIGVTIAVLLVVAAAAGASTSKTSGPAKAPLAQTVTSATSTTLAPPATTSVAAATTSLTSSTTVATSGAPVDTTVSPSRGTGTCRIRGAGEYVLPDPACTPGATNPQVSQADIASTICSSGWTSTIRPPESYTEPLKLSQMAAYGETGSPSGYEEDHLISLELGGSPTDPRNLWPEPGASPNPKDEVENAARSAVCDGRVSLATAQQAIAGNWIAFGQQLGRSPATTVPQASPPPASPSASSTCSPTTSSGHCYKAGEYCPKAYYNRTGTDAEGNTITCEEVGGYWKWE